MYKVAIYLIIPIINTCINNYNMNIQYGIILLYVRVIYYTINANIRYSGIFNL